MTGMLRWYLIHTKPSCEAIASSNLCRQGYEVYLPRLAQPVVPSGRVRERIAALFPRYLFLHLNEGLQSLGPVRCSVGVTGIVRFGSRYAVVPDRVIHDLRRREDGASGLYRLFNRCKLSAGAAIRVTGGPLDGLEGVFEREQGADRVLVLLDMLGQAAHVRILSQFVLPRHAA
jgi:transcriptional antiterminator RfaH